MKEQVYPNITVVNDDDELIGYLPLFDAIAKGVRRRGACVFILNATGQVLMQRRSATVLSPNVLDFSAAGHVNEGNDYLTTAKAELWEELRLKDIELTPLVPPLKVAGFYNAIYRGIIDERVVIEANHEEVAETFWIPFDELEVRIEQNPKEFAENFLLVWPFVRDKILP